MQYSDRACFIWLSAVSGLGSSHLGLITNYCKKHEVDLVQVWQNPELISDIPISYKIVESIKKFKKEYTVSNWQEWLEQQQIRCLLVTENDYPNLLKLVHQPPAVIYVKGDLTASWWQQPVSLVGSRNMTPYGAQATKSLIGELVELGATTVSGGMYGVDLTVHQKTVEFGGQTVVVLGHGFNYSYPSWIHQDHQQILEEGGVLISQFAPFVHPSRGSFVARNRVVAGISPVLVVVEAAERSGTQITAQFALDENRDVCAVPGPIYSPYSQGTKWLINQGARLVSSGHDILFSDRSLDQLAGESSASFASVDAKSEDEISQSDQLLTQIRAEPMSFDQLLSALQLDSATLLIELTKLEIKGKVMKFGLYYRAV